VFISREGARQYAETKTEIAELIFNEVIKKRTAYLNLNKQAFHSKGKIYEQ
jgi:hypothetical protein